MMKMSSVVPLSGMKTNCMLSIGYTILIKNLMRMCCAYLIVDESSNCLDFQHVRIMNSDIQYKSITLFVVSGINKNHKM